MQAPEQAVPAVCDTVAAVFTVRLRGQVHRCALSDDALYLLSQGMDPRLDRIDAYLVLKRRIARAVQACLDDGADGLPPLMQARHLMPPA